MDEAMVVVLALAALAALTVAAVWALAELADDLDDHRRGGAHHAHLRARAAQERYARVGAFHLEREGRHGW